MCELKVSELGYDLRSYRHSLRDGGGHQQLPMQVCLIGYSNSMVVAVGGRNQLRTVI